MTFSLTWLPEVLEKAGLKVAETPDWRSRGRAEMGTVRGVMCHHTANPHAGNMPSLNLLIAGRPDLSGPLCQLGLGRDGTFYVVAAGRANHAGKGKWEGLDTGNSSFIGIEAEHSGNPDDEWPPIQYDAYKRGVAAILEHVRAGANMCCGHKEYALPAGRKSDPTFDMPSFRSQLEEILVGKSPPPPIPARDDRARPTLRRGMRSEDVKVLQRQLGVGDDGIFGGNTEAKLRAWQRAHNLVPDGIAGPMTWAAFDRADAVAPVDGAEAPAGAPPAQPSSGHVLGSLSERYESGGKGPGTVSSGENDPGGVSYGTYQLATKTGTLKAFLEKEGAPWLGKFGANQPGSKPFSDMWKAIAAKQSDEFGRAQHAFIERTHYRPPVEDVLKKTGLDLDKRCDAVRDVCWSVGVQHGRAAVILNEAVRAAKASTPETDPNFDRCLIEEIYLSRDRYVRGVARTLPAKQKATLISICENRYPDERARALAMLG